MERPRKLSASFVRTVRRAGRYGDGRGGYGLSLLVKPTSTGRISRTWAQRLYINGRAVNMGLGAYPVVTLKEARAKALGNRQALARGMDPRSDGIPTFARAAEKVIAIHRANWKPGGDTEEQWRASLRDYAYPKIGHKPVNKITTTDVMAVLLPIWNEKRVTATRVRNRISAVMRWAVAKEYREGNPAGDTIAAALPKNGVPVVHHRALPHARGCAGAGQSACEHVTTRDETGLRVSRSDRVQIGRGSEREVGRHRRRGRHMDRARRPHEDGTRASGTVVFTCSRSARPGAPPGQRIGPGLPLPGRPRADRQHPLSALSTPWSRSRSARLPFLVPRLVRRARRTPRGRRIRARARGQGRRGRIPQVRPLRAAARGNGRNGRTTCGDLWERRSCT